MFSRSPSRLLFLGLRKFPATGKRKDMVITLRLVFVVVALVCFLLSAFGVSVRVNLQSLGLAFLTCTYFA